MKKDKSILRKLIFHVILPLFAGGLLYYLFCPDISFVRWLDARLGGGVHFYTLFPANRAVLWVRYYLFDILWAYALTHVCHLIFDNNAHSYLWCIAVTTLFGAMMEAGQLIGLARGTFDCFDIVWESVGAIIAALIIKKQQENYDHEKI